jgi:choline dehydrogenase-like flavoprotein
MNAGNDPHPVSDSPPDAIIVGAGMGGAAAAFVLSQAGLRVLVIERGLAKADFDPAYAGEYPETFLSRGNRTDVLARSGRATWPVNGWIPVVGGGEGGGSAVYGAALFRFHRDDFAAWPWAYEELAPYYRRCEELFCVRGTPDPLSADERALQEPAPLSAAGTELFDFMQANGLKPFRSPIGFENRPGCRECFGFYCDSDCKKTAGNVFLAPAQATGRVQVLYGTAVEQLLVEGGRVAGVRCSTAQGLREFRAASTFLAAGALMTPVLMLNSRSDHHPTGVGNRHDLVGRHLMRHLIDFYYVKTPSSAKAHGHLIEVSSSACYHHDGKRWGVLNTSAGLMAPAVMASEFIEHMRAISPVPFPAGLAKRFVALFLGHVSRDRVLLNPIIEDTPAPGNRVLPGSRIDDVKIEYTMAAEDARRVKESRRHLMALLRPLSPRLLKVAEDNSFLAHACGTCRMAGDASRGVVDPAGKVFGVDDLYVVDASVFPSSGGVNPSLTVAAAALKLAEQFVRDRSPSPAPAAV